MKIAVCIKAVPDPDYYGSIGFDPATKTLLRGGIPAVLNDGDKHALEEARRIKETCGGEITAICMGVPDAKKQLTEALAMGADQAFLISDRKVAGADSLATSYTIAKAIEQTGPYDLILLGNESADGGTAHVPSQIGEWLGIGHAVNALSLEPEEDAVTITRKFEKGSARYRLLLPCVISVNARINEVRLTSVMDILKAKKKPITLLTAEDIEGLDLSCVGLAGSPSQNGDLEPVSGGKECIMITGEEDEIIAQLCGIITKAMSA